MSNEKRYVLFFILLFLWMMGFPYVMRFLGLNPPPPKKPPVAAAAGEVGKKAEPGDAAKEVLAKASEKGKAGEPEKGKVQPPAAAAEGPKKPEVKLVDESELVLGSEDDHSPGGYRLQAQLTQKGGGVESLSSSRYDAEYEDGRAVKRPLQLIKRDPTWPASLTLTLNASPDGAVPIVPPEEDATAILPREAEDVLDSVTWEVVPDDQGHIRRPVTVTDPATKASVEGQAIVFRAQAPNGVVVTKTYRLGKNIDGLELELRFESPDKPRKVVYNLMGPHGIPIEGEWYTSTFRDLVFGQLAQGNVEPVTTSAYDVAKAGNKLVENTTLPLRYAGVENQYFATVLEPVPPPT